MKKVVIVGPDFVPSSLPPALRIRFFARHLPEFGWEPIVLTTDPRYYGCSLDLENENLLPKSLEVIRTAALPLGLTRKVGIGDIGIRSVWHHWKKLAKLCQQRDVDLIFIPVPPYISMILGRLAYQKFGIPYVIDYIDPWVTEYYWKVPKSQRPPKWFFAYIFSRLIEPFALRQVSHITGVSKGTTEEVISYYPWLNKVGATEIPYGGEPSDFDYLKNHPRGNKIFDFNDGHLHISYVGACIPAMYDVVRALFAAVRLGLDRAPDVFNRLRIHFVGTKYAAERNSASQILRFAQEARIDSVVSEHPGRVFYLDALQILLDSHALVIIGSEEAHYTASKVFPYIMARKPLFAIVHKKSNLIQILQETYVSQITTFDSSCKISEKVNEISRHLETILSLSINYQPSINWKAFELYTAKAMTARLAEVFDSALKK